VAGTVARRAPKVPALAAPTKDVAGGRRTAAIKRSLMSTTAA